MKECKYCGKSKGGYRKPYHRNCKLAFEKGYNKALDNTGVIHGKDAERFINLLDNNTKKIILEDKK